MRLSRSLAYATLSVAATAYVAPLRAQSTSLTVGAVPSESAPRVGTDAAPSIVAPPPRPSRAVVGSRVRIDYAPEHATGTVQRSRRVEGRLTAMDSTRFTLELPDHQTLDVPRDHALSMAVREKVATKWTLVGATLFGVGASIVYTEGLSRSEGRAHVPVWQYGVGPVVGAGFTLLGGHHWVPTSFPR
jgi:hypothetical protein